MGHVDLTGGGLIGHL
jgi:hypothetical protein